jgi:sugar (pentulose or hexulose) kinase
MEGTAYELRMNLEAIEQIGLPKQRIIVSGGCSRSNIWLQILSNILMKDIAVSSVTNVGCLGAAMIAAFGAGRFPTFDSAIQAMRGPARLACKPDNRLSEIYSMLYEAYHSLLPSVMEGSRLLATIQNATVSI